MKPKAQTPKSKIRSLIGTAFLLLLTAHCSLLTALGQNDLQKIADGRYVERWLVSNIFPAEIDAGVWENFNRFNVERLPQKDWLAPFGGVRNINPQSGTQKATTQKATTQARPSPPSAIPNPQSENEPLPEVGAVSGGTKVLADASEITWRETAVASPRLDFFSLAGGGGKSTGTAYAAAYVNSERDEYRFLETDGFLGAVWLNGEKIYDGYVLNARKMSLARFRKGENLLLVRASGVSGDYWRKDGGWNSFVRIWKTQKAGGMLFGALRPGERTQNSTIGKFVGEKFNSYLEQVYLVTVFNPAAETVRDVSVKVDDRQGLGAGRGGISVNGQTWRDVEINLLGFFAGERPVTLTVSTPQETNSLQTQITSAPVPTAAGGTVFYLEGFHVDPVYLHDQRGYSRITLSNTSQYVSSLRADPLYGVFLSEIDYLKPYLDTHPEDREFLKKAVSEGRVGTGGAYNQFNELTIGGESIIRNILYGQAMHEAMLGRRAQSLALWDVFGHAPQISQIALKAGFSGLTWSKKITGFEPFFYDYALDGSRLLHRRVDYAYSFSGFGSGKNYTLDDFRKMTERKFAEQQTFKSAVDLRINAADFTPPWTNLAGNVEKLEGGRPRIRVTGQAQDLYFEALNKEIAAGKTRPPVTSRDKLFFHVGVMAARSDLKIAHRLAENTTLAAEKFATIAYLRGAKYPDLALDKAWRQIFFGSHHDAITGTPSDSAFLDLVHGYREAFELSKGALDDSLAFIAGQIDTNPKSQIQNLKSNVIPVVVFNPLSWKRTDVVKVGLRVEPGAFGLEVRDAEGKIIPSTVLEANPPNRFGSQNFSVQFVATDVPSLGFKTFYFGPDQKGRLQLLSAEERDRIKKQNPGLESQSRKTIENEFYRVSVDGARGGAITSIYDKRAGREIVNPKNGHYANEIAALREELTKKNVVYPAWEFWTTGEKKFSTEKSAKVSLKIAGGSQTLYVEGELPNMQKFVQTIQLHNGIKRIDFKTELVDYRGKDELFVVNFPLDLTGGALVTEDRFGTVVRNNSKGFLDFRTNTDKLVSGAPVYAVNNWAEYGSTLTLNFVSPNSSRRGDGATRRRGEEETEASASPHRRVPASQKSVASIPLKPTALVRPHGENYEELTEQIVSSLIKRGVSVTPFYDDNDAGRRRQLTIEDSTMPKKLNDDIPYHGFRIALGGEKENLYAAALFRQISAETKQKFEERLKKDGYAYLFVYDTDIPAGWPPVPVLLIGGDTKSAVENLLAPIEKGEFALNIPAESLVDGANLPTVPDYGVALINNATPAVSLENPNTLTLFLTHTAAFPGVNLPFEFVPENKTHVFTYALYPHEGDWREADTVKVGYDFNNPLIAKQTDIHKGNLPSEHSFFSFDVDPNGNKVLTSLKVGENPQADFRTKALENRRKLIMRFNETEGRKSPLLFTFSPRPPSAGDHQFDDVFWKLNSTDLLENELPMPEIGRSTNLAQAKFRTGIGGFGIETFSLKVDGQVDKSEIKDRPPIGMTKEIVQPVFARYWMHNAGAAPIGNDAVKISLRRVEQMDELSGFAYDDQYNQGGTTTAAVRVQVVNNYQDRNYKGEVTLEVPEDWRVVPEKLSFDIAPGGSFVTDVVVVAFPVKKGEEWERASGLVKARVEHDGQIFQDVLQIGKPWRLEWRVEKTENGVVVRIKNPHRQTIEGAVALIKPLETWTGNSSSSAPLPSPRELGFSAPARGEITLSFPGGYEPAGTWAVARIAYNGFVDYRRADGPTK